jgi:hypothetical protein
MASALEVRPASSQSAFGFHGTEIALQTPDFDQGVDVLREPSKHTLIQRKTQIANRRQSA